MEFTQHEQSHGKDHHLDEDLYHRSLQFEAQFLLTGELGDIEKAIALCKEALEDTPKDHADFVRRRHDFAHYHRLHFIRSREKIHLREAIRIIDSTLEATPEEHHDYAALLQMKSVLLVEDGSDSLRDAIKFGRLAVEATPKGHPKRSERLRNLSSLFENMSSIKPVDETFDEAILLGQEAIDSLPENHEDLNVCRINLAICFRRRFHWMGRGEDLNRGIELGKAALENIGEYYTEYMECANLVVACLQSRFIRTGHRNDIDEAIRLGLEARNTSTKNTQLQIESLKLLASNYLARSRKFDSREDLDTSIELAEQCITKNFGDDLGVCDEDLLHNLCLCYKDRYCNTKDMMDFISAINYGERAAATAGEDNSNLAECLYALAECHRAQHNLAAGTDLDTAIYFYRMALYHEPGIPLTRIKAGVAAARCHGARGEWCVCVNVFDSAFDLLPKVTLRTGTRSDLQNTLKIISGYGSDAASAVLKADSTYGGYQAVRMLEKSRGIIASMVVDSRTEFTSLKTGQPELELELRTKFSQLRDRMFIPPSAGSQYASQMARQNMDHAKLEDILQRIRAQPGFESFLLAPTKTDIMHLAVQGPIVHFNISSYSAEALLISETTIEALALPELKNLELETLVLLLSSHGMQSKRDAKLKLTSSSGESKIKTKPSREAISTGMISLWENAIKPVLERLGLLGDKKPDKRLPHIWWVGGGLMALLPLHAAGRHDAGSTENTISHVISSYAPTLKSLQFARSKPWTVSESIRTKLLAVAMPRTPGIPGYLAAKEEIAAIENVIGSHGMVTTLEQPSKEDVLREFRDSTICHFACHGQVNDAEPARSALLLGDTILEELRVEDLDTVHHQKAQIAYLSACSTAEIRLHSLLDESVHLASTFLLTGFPHVIGTLWGAQDAAAVEVAKGFYEELLRTKDGHMSVATSLHKAVLNLRNSANNSSDILKWGTFIHLGS